MSQEKPIWVDRLSDSTMALGPLTIWIDEGAEGWRIHTTLLPFVIAKRGTSRDAAKSAAVAIMNGVACALRDLVTPKPSPPRPDDMVELAKQVAKELRNRGIWVYAGADTHYQIVIPTREPGGRALYPITAPAFGAINAVEIADLIQAEEARKAQEWAGDK